MAKRMISVSMVSPFTCKTNTIRIYADCKDLDRWRNGELIQNALPYLNRHEREFLVSGVPEDEWNEHMVDHPNLEWAKAHVKEKKGDKVTMKDLDSMQWDGLNNCYMMLWAGMVLGIEKDGHMHS